MIPNKLELALILLVSSGFLFYPLLKNAVYYLKPDNFGNYPMIILTKFLFYLNFGVFHNSLFIFHVDSEDRELKEAYERDGVFFNFIALLILIAMELYKLIYMVGQEIK